MRRLGFNAREYEVRRNPLYDLTCRKTLKHIHADFDKGLVIAAMLAPPCDTFSPARDRTAVIRTKDCPWGLPRHLVSDKDWEKLKRGNQTMRAAIGIAKHMLKRNLPWALENPHPSKCWSIPGLKTLSADTHVDVMVVDFCAYGTPWRKRTRILVGNVAEPDLGRLANKRCPATDGFCPFRNRKHFELTGSSHDGTPWARIAQPYPAKLCRDLAHILTCRYHY